MTNQDVTERYQWKLWIENRDPDAGDTLVRMYTPLVNYHVQRISAGLPKNVSRDEIKSLGYQGLFDALTKFDPSRDLKFDTYASFRIRGTIIDGLRKEDWLSRSSREKTKKMDEEISKLEQSYLRTVTPEEVADHLGITTDQVYQTVHEQYFANVLSIDEKMNDEDDHDQTFVLQDEQTKTPEQQAVKGELIEDLITKIKELNENEQLVLSLFYQEDMTLTEIGEILSLSTSRISQIHSKALFKLRSLLAAEITDGGIL
ncbi:MULTISPECIES: FliA/WhiG family RNA polymerase sigma factor [unclassified Sporosarcina]|uniref:FliA/WhiG family RNA polymerase sigma factor n=1 Tax=unclassified Sporosarcina TaxID=2647733 RepID=UPI000C16BFC1|nr:MULTISPECIES: FliA/WhiG family RNA polymerase sigma factor [unclassified Sporosarcina]PIC87645.1 FliA/WhiG family RNA polymerase sigma factor [Sporosarcina sp. P20a]PID00184.1 FliA/WhiG family RNA polymerase sigma factor [Sporosarcina sp. P29]PID06868.1 FliA/WhiG family RNA polymerase sigma factor [Sporosarcina sp. P30]PID10062.1 FliA/WhiG family RNA polymerase sigma factor [Sporosarcina sp. P31]PID13641.1 FliA/WhiG family RNA polymerase sigma factor [Sporosarcina sp. P32b]